MITLLGLMLYGIFLHYERSEGEHLGAPCVNQTYAIALEDNGDCTMKSSFPDNLLVIPT